MKPKPKPVDKAKLIEAWKKAGLNEEQAARAYEALYEMFKAAGPEATLKCFEEILDVPPGSLSIEWYADGK